MSNTTQVYLGAEAVDWVAAAGTVGAVVVALGLQWLQWWRLRRHRPLLLLSFNSRTDRVNVPPQPAASERQRPEIYRSHWVRPRVTNEAGRNSAEDVEVVLVRIEALDPEGGSGLESMPEERLLEGLSLKWSEVESAKASLPPGVARHIDLLHVDNMGIEADGEDLNGRAPIRFGVYPPPAAKYHRGFRKRYSVTLALTARDTDATFYKTVVEYDLKRRDDMEGVAAALTVEGVFPDFHVAPARWTWERRSPRCRSGPASRRERPPQKRP